MKWSISDPPGSVNSCLVWGVTAWCSCPVFVFCLYTTLFWTLSTCRLAWPPPKVSLSTARSWPSHCPLGESWVMCASVVCMCWWVHSEGRGDCWSHLSLLGLGSSESCRLFLEETQREQGRAGWTRAGCLSRSLASRWHQAGDESSSYFTRLPSAHQVGTLQALSCNWEVFPVPVCERNR